MSLSQRTDLLRVESIEAADSRDAGRERAGHETSDAAEDTFLVD
jgi:hypothetical protein